MCIHTEQAEEIIDGAEETSVSFLEVDQPSHVLTRSLVMGYVKLVANAAENESVVGPRVCEHVIDFVQRLIVDKNEVIPKTPKDVVRKWYSLGAGNAVVPPFNARTKTPVEILKLIEEDDWLSKIFTR